MHIFKYDCTASILSHCGRSKHTPKHFPLQCTLLRVSPRSISGGRTLKYALPLHTHIQSHHTNTVKCALLEHEHKAHTNTPHMNSECMLAAGAR